MSSSSCDSGFDSLYGFFNHKVLHGRSHQKMAGNGVSVTQEGEHEEPSQPTGVDAAKP